MYVLYVEYICMYRHRQADMDHYRLITAPDCIGSLAASRERNRAVRWPSLLLLQTQRRFLFLAGGFFLFFFGLEVVSFFFSLTSYLSPPSHLSLHLSLSTTHPTPHHISSLLCRVGLDRNHISYHTTSHPPALSSGPTLFSDTPTHSQPTTT